MKRSFITLPLLLPTVVFACLVDHQINCHAKELNTIDQLICADSGLLQVDQHMAKVYQQALTKSDNRQAPVLRAEQRGWIKGKAECWKDANQKACVTELYIRRIAELQARYDLVAVSKRIVLQCENNPAHEVALRYYATTPATVIADYGDQVSLMFQQNDQNYLGRNEKLSQVADVFMLQWGYNKPEIRCAAH